MPKHLVDKDVFWEDFDSLNHGYYEVRIDRRLGLSDMVHTTGKGGGWYFTRPRRTVEEVRNSLVMYSQRKPSSGRHRQS